MFKHLDWKFKICLNYAKMINVLHHPDCSLREVTSVPNFKIPLKRPLWSPKMASLLVFKKLTEGRKIDQPLLHGKQAAYH